MKYIFASLLFLLLFSGVTLAHTTRKDSIQVLSIAQFEQLSAKRKAKIIDVRTPEEAAEGHLIGAATVNFLGADFAREVQGLPKNKTYLLYCKSGIRSGKAADSMQKMGFKHVYMLEDGINAWKEAEKPLEK